MAIEVVDVLRNVLPVDEALMHYIRAFELASVPAQLVFQRALSRLAELQPVDDAPPALESVPRLSRPTARPAVGFGLRAIV
jgi:hypothetical protein